MWFVAVNGSVYNYTYSNSALTRRTAGDLSLGSGTWEGAVSIGDRVWFIDNSADKAVGYVHSNGTLTRSTQ